MSIKRTLFYWKRLSWLMMTACFLMVFSCSESVPFPQELCGNWRSQDASYADRYIQISENQLILGTGKGHPNIFYIEDFSQQAADARIEWTFYCEISRGGTFELTILYSPGPEAVLQFKNTPDVHWYKMED